MVEDTVGRRWGRRWRAVEDTNWDEGDEGVERENREGKERKKMREIGEEEGSQAG